MTLQLVWGVQTVDKALLLQGFAILLEPLF